MLWNCSVAFRSSIQDEQADPHKFPKYKIKNPTVNFHYPTPPIATITQTKPNKRITADDEKSKEHTKKKSLKQRPYSLKPKDIAAPSYPQAPINFIFGYLPESLGAPPHTIYPTRPHTSSQADMVLSAHLSNMQSNLYFNRQQHTLTVPKSSLVVEKPRQPVRVNSSIPTAREFKVAFNIVPSPKNRVKAAEPIVLKHPGPQSTRICSPAFGGNVSNGPQPSINQFRKVKPTFRVTNFFNNDSPQINIEVHRSAKFSKCPFKSHRTPNDQQQKEDKENAISKISPPTEFKIEDDRPTLPTMDSIDTQQPKSNIRKGKRIQDFLTTREEIKSVRDSDDLSEHERSQVLTTYSTIMKEHGRFQLDSRN